VTEFYSIENYLACEEAARRICSDFVVLKRCSLPKDKIVERFLAELREFHRLVTPIMAWTICLKRNGIPVALQNLNLADMFSFDANLRITRNSGTVPYLINRTGVPNNPALWADLRRVIRELKPLNPKRFTRGKFETWFLVTFIKAAIEQLELAAQAASGGVEVLVRVERGNVIALLAPEMLKPCSLETFLNTHLGTGGPEPVLAR
jgi:hypothetical protein